MSGTVGRLMRTRCGICGRRIRSGPIAFIGPDDGRTCFADPWMHPACAEIAMAQCPFLTGRRDWRDPAARSDPLTHPYSRGMRVGDRVLPATDCTCAPLADVEAVYWAYRTWLAWRLTSEPEYLEPLRGRTIACWCDKPEIGYLGRPILWCHGTAILDLLEKYRPNPKPGGPIEFGRHTMPAPNAEAAEAWPSLATLRQRADAKFRREQRKVRA